jgi:hypothetical protein
MACLSIRAGVTEPRLRLVADGAKAPPYPADTKMTGPFPLDMARLTASDTWTLAAPTPELRPWLLMLWAISWTQVPAGAFSDDDALIAAKIGMNLQAFQLNRTVLMRGWWKAADGRYYHNIVSDLVLDKLHEREEWRKRQGLRRVTEKPHRQSNVTRDSTVTHGGVQQESRAAGAGAGAGAGELVGKVLENTLRSPRSARTKRRDLQGKRLAADAALPDEWKAWAIDCYPNLKPPEVGRMWVEFRNYWSDKPGKDALKLSWRQTWENNVHRRMRR